MDTALLHTDNCPIGIPHCELCSAKSRALAMHNAVAAHSV